MKKTLPFIIILLTLLCCSEHPGWVNIRGKFAHLEQGEFFIYSPDGGLDRMDSLHIREGRFNYDFPLSEGRATMRILYPNYSQLAIFVRPGDDIRVEGDAQNLNGVKVSGTEENEVYTRFRLESQGQSTQQIRDLAQSYILEHPTLAMSQHLFREYFLLVDSLDATIVRSVYDSLCRANPGDVLLSRLSSSVRSYGLIAPGKPCPEFRLTVRSKEKSKVASKEKSEKKKDKSEKVKEKSEKQTKEKPEENPSEVKLEDYKDRYLLIVFWAGWKSGSQSGVFRARSFRRKIKKEYPLSLLSYSLDVREESLSSIERRDTIDYPSYCDFRCWRSPLVEQWGIHQLPYFVLVGPDQKIVACGTDWMRDIEPKVQFLCL